MVSATQLVHFSQNFHKFHDRQFLSLLDETGLSMREFHVLLFLINNPGYDTARDVTKYRGLIKSQVSQAVEVLCGRDFLRRTPDQEDRRVVHLTLTEAGLTLARQAQRIQQSCYNLLFAGFSPEEEAQFHDLLARVLDNSTTLDSAIQHPTV